MESSFTNRDDICPAGAALSESVRHSADYRQAVCVSDIQSSLWAFVLSKAVICATLGTIKRQEEEEKLQCVTNWSWSAGLPCSCVVLLSHLTLELIVTIGNQRVGFAGTQQYVVWWVVQTDAGKHSLQMPERDVAQLEDLGCCFFFSLSRQRKWSANTHTHALCPDIYFQVNKQHGLLKVVWLQHQ